MFVVELCFWIDSVISLNAGEKNWLDWKQRLSIVVQSACGMVMDGPTVT